VDDDVLTAKDIASRSTWADRYRDSDRNTNRVHYNATQHWHYINIELDSPDVDAPCFGRMPPGKPASEGPAEACVTEKIDQFWRELRDRSLNHGERILAFKYLLHLVGDVHQPLHAADNHDHGGNCEQVITVAGIRKSLHSFWDFDVVTAVGAGPSQAALALVSEITPIEASGWSSITPTSWALESYQVAKTASYNASLLSGCRSGRAVGPVQLSPEYEQAAVSAARTQLKKAGVRLAAVLNDALQ
jgi:hypothetical protein